MYKSVKSLGESKCCITLCPWGVFLKAGLSFMLGASFALYITLYQLSLSTPLAFADESVRAKL